MNGREENEQGADPTYTEGIINQLFLRLPPQEVEQFYRAYQHWSIQQQISNLQTQIAALQEQIASNAEQMQLFQPSAISLATLARLQAGGVSDIELLDRMLERGEQWLDHTMQLLEHCERLDIIHDGYATWCENALEGAYDWIASIDTNDAFPSTADVCDESKDEPSPTETEQTEQLLLQKLQSEEEVETSPLIVEQEELIVSPGKSSLDGESSDISVPSQDQGDINVLEDVSSPPAESSVHEVSLSTDEQHVYKDEEESASAPPSAMKEGTLLIDEQHPRTHEDELISSDVSINEHDAASPADDQREQAEHEEQTKRNTLRRRLLARVWHRAG